MFVDTHAHLHFKDFNPDSEDAIKRARDAGLAFLVEVGTTMQSTEEAIALAEKYPFIYASAGVHPHDAEKMTPAEWERFEKFLAHPKVVAVGETGLDYFKNYCPHPVQKEAFLTQIRLALKHGKPLIVHCRDAHADCREILSRELPKPSKGVLHCFSGTPEDAKFYVDMGFFISAGGPLTYPKAEPLRKAIAGVPVERFMLETDCPYLPPQKFRGMRNEPAYIKHIVPELAAIYHLSAEDIERITTLNAATLFGIEEFEDQFKIVYPIRDSIYINLTNRCTNKCTFCVRYFSDHVKGHNLRFKESDEPDAAAVIKALGDVTKYREAVFCGFGEPTLRLEVLKQVAAHIKGKGIKVRLDTNGHGNMINKRAICAELAGLVDAVTVSLNAPDAETYDELCVPDFGRDAHPGVIEFIKDAKSHIKDVQATVVTAPGVDVEACRRMAESLGVGLRVRIYNEVG